MLLLRSLALTLPLCLAACASRPPPALLLAEKPALAAGAHEVAMFAVTTRQPVDDPGQRFGGGRTLVPRFAALTISIPPSHKTGEISWPSAGRGDPATTFATTQFTDIPREGIGAALRNTVNRTGKRHVLLFVHGYNTRFDEAAFRLAQIVHDSGAPVTPVLFSWASRGELSGYGYDRESASIARDGLELAMAALAKDPSVNEVTILAHSMGGWLTMEALRQMAIRNRAIPAKIRSVMLAAPDVDVDVAASHGQTVRDIKSKPRMAIFISTDDKALDVSRFLFGGRDRLGSFDPTQEPYRTNIQRSGVEIYDLTKETGEDGFNHGKFASNPLVVQMIGRRLAGGQRLRGGSALE